MLESTAPCICSQLRRTTRKVSALYDKALAPSGLTVTQYALLTNIGRMKRVSRTALADHVGMDRTTLTRNLMPLESEGLVVAAESDDRRQRLLALSAEGLRRQRTGYSLWEKAQRELSGKLGEKHLKSLRNSLNYAETAATAS